MMKGSQPNANSVEDLIHQMAGAFGKDGSELDQEVGEVWKKLTELHDLDPKAYQSFIQRQMEEAHSLPPTGTIIPNKGFVVKAFTKGFKVFINFCQHEAVCCPVDGNAEPLNMNASVMGVEIPLVVSELRTTLVAHTVDVVFHPWCLLKSSSDATFKNDIVQLALSAIGEDRNLSFDEEWKFIKSQYKGGVGKGGNEVHPLPVVKKDGSVDGNFEKVMDNPSSLLQSLNMFKHEEDDSNGFSFIKNKNRSTLKKSTNLIQEIRTCEENEWEENKDTEIQSKTNHEKSVPSQIKEVRSTRKNVVLNEQIIQSRFEKGFLNRKGGRRKHLYDKPSTGDGLGGEGGSFSKLMSKYQVVGTADFKEDKDEWMPSEMKKGFLNNQIGFDEISKKTTAPESSESIPNNTDSVDAQTLHQLLLGVSTDTGDSSARDDVATTKRGQKMKIEDDSSIPYMVKEQNNTTIVDADLSNTMVSSINDVAIDSFDNVLTVATSCGRLLRYQHPCVGNTLSTKMRMKNKLLEIIIPHN